MEHLYKRHYQKLFNGCYKNCFFNCIAFQWAYNEFISIVPNTKAVNNQEFIISMKKGAKKTDSMKFSTDHRADLLTEALVRLLRLDIIFFCIVFTFHQTVFILFFVVLRYYLYE